MTARGERPQPWRAHRVLHPNAVTSAAGYVAAGGGRGLRRAAELGPDGVIEAIRESGLRGRGGGGFPTGVKWRTVADNGAASAPPVVVVNGAEGEPGTFKDRSIVRRNPYLVIEGACIAAGAVGAERVVIALKRAFVVEVTRVRRALADLRQAGAVPAGLVIDVFEGPDEYLYGEESAMLEAIDGRGPFPRVVPTYRVGLAGAREPCGPALVNNLETIANVPRILERGVDWFRSVGTAESPGTVVCTVTGDTRQHAVGEVRMGTPLRQVLRVIGGGPRPGRPVKAVLSGVANPVITAAELDAPLSHEGLRSIGCGLGAVGFIVFDESADMVAVAAGVARFLSVESCGQCTPCKTDGLELARLLARLARNDASHSDLATIERRARTVSFGARCYLGVQQETVLTSLLARFRPEFEAHLSGRAAATGPVPITELIDIRAGVARIDTGHARKQSDWSFAPASSGKAPADVRIRRP